MSAHSELSDFEISALSPEFEKCITIASTEPKGVGEQCDKDELTAMKTNRPFVEKEKENGAKKAEKENGAEENKENGEQEEETASKKPALVIDLEGITTRALPFPVGEERYSTVRGVKGKALFV